MRNMRMFVLAGCLTLACSSAIADGMSDRASLSAAASWVEHQQAHLSAPDAGQAMLADRLAAMPSQQAVPQRRNGAWVMPALASLAGLFVFACVAMRLRVQRVRIRTQAGQRPKLVVVRGGLSDEGN